MHKLGIQKSTMAYNTLSLSPTEVLSSTLENMKNLRYLNAFNWDVRNNSDEIMRMAAKSEERYKQGKPLSAIDGIPISFKDNYLVKNMPSTAGSKILKDFIPPLDATLVRRWKEAGAIVIGKTNMDEFGMGSFNFYADKIPVNPIDPDLVVGGSSGGAAVATASYQGMAAFGTDTGGSVTFPANCWSIYGFKPSYGRLSRHGVILYSSSNDAPGILAQSMEDIISMLNIVDGEDKFDSNSIQFNEQEFPNSLKGIRVGIAREFNISELPKQRVAEQLKIIDILEDQGAEVIEVSIPLLKQILPIYYTIIPAEAASNLSRYDGLKYGLQSKTIKNEDSKINYEEYVKRIRTEGFGINGRFYLR